MSYKYFQRQKTDRQTDMKKLTVAFSNFANSPKTVNGSEVDI